MPDSRTHRGAHPNDAHLFSPDQFPSLRTAAAELTWLLDRGYALRSSTTLVGDRHSLTQRQRLALNRCACNATQLVRRCAHEITAHRLRESEVWIDGYNLLITAEAALGGGVIFVGRDGCYRDLASLHGTYRAVEETEPALRLIGAWLAELGAGRCTWFLDRPVSNSAKLRIQMLQLAAIHSWRWDVELEFSPDARLAASPAIVITSDSVILDRCAQWFNGARELIRSRMPSARILDLFQ